MQIFIKFTKLEVSLRHRSLLANLHYVHCMLPTTATLHIQQHYLAPLHLLHHQFTSSEEAKRTPQIPEQLHLQSSVKSQLLSLNLTASAHVLESWKLHMPVIFSSFLRFSSSLQYFAHSRPRASTAASPRLIVLVHSEETVPAT
jgi:hypothetical protein